MAMVKGLLRVHIHIKTKSMQMTSKFGYFCGIHFKSMTVILCQDIIRILGILYNFWSAYTNMPLQIQHKEGLLLLLIWQCFPCNLTYQKSLISVISLFLLGENTSFEIFQEPSGNSQFEIKNTSFRISTLGILSRTVDPWTTQNWTVQVHW